MKEQFGVLEFDEEALLDVLSSNTPAVRSVVALASAERLKLGFCRFSKQAGRDATPYLRALELAWSGVSGAKVDISGLVLAREAVMSLVPDDADETTNVPDLALGQDAASALIYAIECQLEGGATEAMWAMRCAYDAADNIVNRLSSGAYGDEELILAHPLIQAELSRQSADLGDLTLVSEVTVEKVNFVRERAARDANAFLALCVSP